MSLKRLANVVRYLHALSSRLLARAKGLPEPAHRDRCPHVWITLKRQRFCRLCRRFERKVAKWRHVHREDALRIQWDGRSTGGRN